MSAFVFVILRKPKPTRSTRKYTLFPYTTCFRSVLSIDYARECCEENIDAQRLHFVQRFSDIFGGTDHRVKIRQELGETEFVDRGCIAATGHDMFGRIVARPIFEYSFPIDYRQIPECDRKSAVSGKIVSVRVDLCGRRI